MKILSAITPIKPHATPSEIADWLHLWTGAPINDSHEVNQVKRLMAVHELSKLEQPCPYRGFRALSVTDDLETWEDLDKYLNGDFPESYAHRISGVDGFLQSYPAKEEKQLVFRLDMQPSDLVANIHYLIKRLPVSQREKIVNDKNLQDCIKQEEFVAASGTLKKALHQKELFVVGIVVPGEQKVTLCTPRKSSLQYDD